MTTEPTSVTAGRLCRQPSFQAFLGVPDANAAAIHVRRVCGIKSRRELDTNVRAARRFHTMRRQFAYGSQNG